jgi:hypothetical protein
MVGRSRSRGLQALIVTMHHVLCHGWSMSAPLRDGMQSMPTPEQVVPALERLATGVATPGT